MEQLIHAFGIDARLIVIQIINFVVLVALLSYFLYKPVLKLLREREQKIAQGIKDAEAAASARARAEEERKAVLAAAHSEAEAVSSRAKEHAGTEAEEIVAAAREKAATIVAGAQVQGDELKAQALKQSEGEVAKVAILAAEKILREKAS